MSYEQIKDLRPTDFKRYCGVEPETFRRMVEVVSNRLTRTRGKVVWECIPVALVQPCRVAARQPPAPPISRLRSLPTASGRSV